jgi:hypothetical protein
MRKQTQITETRHERYYKQLGVKKNRISFLWGNRNGHQNVKTHTRTTHTKNKLKR